MVTVYQERVIVHKGVKEHRERVPGRHKLRGAGEGARSRGR
ncbi:hypothetical protein E2C01_065411 [Portunus trituberculatus]|uniref:Uncharacterized protein n=1 Tax=Portunus trituberculatus TaxID=210409 RepID=A0A5B7HEI0_PORTR|nr:hypothetical protein [Portunus trituberculatus]